MNTESINTIKQVLFNREAVLSMILPALIYGLTYWYFDLVEAVVASGIYAIVASFFLKSTKYVAFIFALFGLIELCIIWLIPDSWLLETLFIKSLIGALQVAIIFILFSLFKEPIPKLFAEAGSPELRDWDFSSTKTCLNIWQSLSYIWVSVYFFKALILISFYPVDADTLVTLNLLLGWPLHVGLIVFSVFYIRNKFASYDTQT
ncbi:DUF3159 domain-containing protein [Exilibacterium tricleocarpae]|uniref:DUF3159 domain-containing protein n=1 Tax=Exilibacterium tricleocarpae TaxID=2591008 RepID=A0A545SM97_9GAMM|nr:DUF3159 domain-containing protein [Exilibacterium tricleocarpae]TQV65976.1 DUF3159 domain-containing protein [Exilibacterium tricleocarpae]